MQKNYVLGGLLLAMTALTLYTSVDHHAHIAERYGIIANIFVPAIALGFFLLGAFISLLFQWGINVIQFEKVVKLLPESEAAVVLALFKRGSITQSEIASETGLSRPTVSRIVAELESKELTGRKEISGGVLVVPKLKAIHPQAQFLTRLPGLSETRLLIVVIVLFLSGISFSLLNSYHVLILQHPLEDSLYLLAIEFFTLGASFVLLLRRRISDIQLEKTLSILPDDEKAILKLIHTKKSITQNELTDSSGVYKMKVSRIISKFEAKGIIEKKPYGFTNLIKSKI